jgi:hypothetical protein
MRGLLSQAVVVVGCPQVCWTWQATPTPKPSPTILQAPPAAPLEIIGAVLAIAFALVAGFLGYRIIRGGRGL